MLGCIQPMSSPMMTTMLGFCAVCAAAGDAPMPTRKLDAANAPMATFRTLAPKSISYSLLVLPLASLRRAGG